MTMASSQSEAIEDPTMNKHSIILRRFRSLFSNSKYVTEPIQAYIIPNHDQHMNEYLSDGDKRLQFISNFSGSSGTAVITQRHACLWTDARYYIQAANELPSTWNLMKMGIASTLSETAWLCANLEKGSRVGVDPKTITYSRWFSIQRELEVGGHTLVAIQQNLVDIIWEDRSPIPCNPICPHPLSFSGQHAKAKIDEIREKMFEKDVEMLVVAALDDIAWLLNLRGSDIMFNPVFYAFLILTHNEGHLFIDERKLTLDVRNHFNSEDIPLNLHSYDSIYSFLSNQLFSQETPSKVWLCSDVNYELYSRVPDKQRYCDSSPITALKAVKNEVEIKGMINAHIKDAVALCRYFSWLEEEVKVTKVTEISGAEKLEQFRRDEADYIGPSFGTISASGLHAAITHYLPSKESDKEITTDEIYLCDSGGQYLDGTTDVTRTMHFGLPSDFMKECFTRVFQGQTSLGTAIFPHKIKGNVLDILARKPLWNVGLDYGHGTGHGIGSYLYVHEGPMGISWRCYPNDSGLEANMFLSNEPGYYEEGKFGIRLENIVRIVPVTTPYKFRHKEFLTFETITLVPIQRKLLVPSLLTADEIAYLNAYHKTCRDTIGPILKERNFHSAYSWLIRETEPLD